MGKEERRSSDGELKQTTDVLFRYSQTVFSCTHTHNTAAAAVGHNGRGRTRLLLLLLWKLGQPAFFAFFDDHFFTLRRYYDHDHHDHDHHSKAIKKTRGSGSDGCCCDLVVVVVVLFQSAIPLSLTLRGNGTLPLLLFLLANRRTNEQ